MLEQIGEQNQSMSISMTFGLGTLPSGQLQGCRWRWVTSLYALWRHILGDGPALGFKGRYRRTRLTSPWRLRDSLHGISRDSCSDSYAACDLLLRWLEHILNQADLPQGSSMQRSFILGLSHDPPMKILVEIFWKKLAKSRVTTGISIMKIK